MALHNTQEPPTKIIRILDFSAGGNSERFRRDGWFENEYGVWAFTSGSRLAIPIRPGTEASSYIIVARVAPFLGDKELLERRIELRLNGAILFSGMTDRETIIGIPVTDEQSKAFLIDFRFPKSEGQSMIENSPASMFGMQIKNVWIFACKTKLKDRERRWPPLIRPTVAETESRVLSTTGLSKPSLLVGFESLGHSCDFGFSQRDAGIEPLGLFRWAGISTVCAFYGIVNRFRGLGENDSVSVYISDDLGEYWIKESNYDIHFHTFAPPQSVSREGLLLRESSRLPSYAENLMKNCTLVKRFSF